MNQLPKRILPESVIWEPQLDGLMFEAVCGAVLLSVNTGLPGLPKRSKDRGISWSVHYYSMECEVGAAPDVESAKARAVVCAKQVLAESQSLLAQLK